MAIPDHIEVLSIEKSPYQRWGGNQNHPPIPTFRWNVTYRDNRISSYPTTHVYFGKDELEVFKQFAKSLSEKGQFE